jgi:alkanesulfonate monooxygenase
LVKLGIHSFLIRDFDPYKDMVEFGRALIPRLRAGAVELDRAKAA